MIISRASTTAFLRLYILFLIVLGLVLTSNAIFICLFVKFELIHLCYSINLFVSYFLLAQGAARIH